MPKKSGIYKNRKKALWFSIGIPIFLLIACVIFTLCFVNFNSLSALNKITSVPESDVYSMCSDNFFGAAIKPNMNRTTSSDLDEVNIDLKLFGFIKLGSKKLRVVKDREVFIGGEIVATTFTTKGVIISGEANVLSSNGEVSPAKKSGLNIGDVILSANDKTINSVESITQAVSDAGESGEEIKLGVLKNGKHKEVNIKPALDLPSQSYKLGLLVKDDMAGVGTLTYIDKEKMEFGALGHPLYDESCKELLDASSGSLNVCNVLGVDKSTPGRAGGIKAYPGYGEKNYLGTIKTNSTFGIYGDITNKSFLENKKSYMSCGRFSVKPGNAQICAQINNNKPELFDIKIIKTSRQMEKGAKGLVIKITDKRLLAKTGGIVQGMSGSPIIQDNKFVGAVTHMFLNDPSKGYGIYSDFMFDNI